jgi:hypothetical protein
VAKICQPGSTWRGTCGMLIQCPNSRDSIPALDCRPSPGIRGSSVFSEFLRGSSHESEVKGFDSKPRISFFGACPEELDGEQDRSIVSEVILMDSFCLNQSDETEFRCEKANEAESHFSISRLYFCRPISVQLLPSTQLSATHSFSLQFVSS